MLLKRVIHNVIDYKQSAFLKNKGLLDSGGFFLTELN